MTERMWHYVLGGERNGPVPDVEMAELFRRKVIEPETLVWTKGLKQWKALREVAELGLDAAPPPIPVTAPTAEGSAPSALHPDAHSRVRLEDRTASSTARRAEGYVAQGRKRVWFSRIKTREDALKMVKDMSMAFLVLAGIQAVLSFAVDSTVLYESAILAVGGFFLRRFNSRSAAVVLLLIAALGIGVTFANAAGADLGGGRNFVLALIVLWAAIRALEATFKLHGQFAVDVQETLRTPRPGTEIENSRG